MNSPFKNQITTRQTRPEMVDLLRAQYRAYASAKWLQGGFVVLSIIPPMLGYFLINSFPQTKEYLALSALILVLLDVSLLDHLQKERMKLGAKLQETFDVAVLELPWNHFIAGSNVPPEQIAAGAIKPLSASQESHFTPWYETCVAEVPITIGRLICQRTNLYYDEALRKKYSATLLFCVFLLGVGLLAWGVANNLKFSELLVFIAASIMPLLNWALREWRKQSDCAARLANLKSEFEKIWQKVLNQADDKELTQYSRDLQNAIFQHRASAPLIYDWSYRLLRNKQEQYAERAARDYVNQALATIANLRTVS